MKEKHPETPKHSSEEAVRQFVEAQLRGEQPDLNRLIAQYPDRAGQIRQQIQSFQCVNSLFDALGHAQEGEFADQVANGDLLGQEIGSFKIEKVIGRGGMGVVYLAQDTKLDRFVAIKSVPGELAQNEHARTRFQREATTLASLNHPNIAVIHDMIERPEKSGLLVMEYVRGRTLAEHIKDRRLKLEEVLGIGQQVAEALSAAYEQGIIHRDIKPSNIKVTDEDRVKVLDFGLAKESGSRKENSDISITQPGRVVGTPAYMSPEQARGHPIDHRSDIWSFACVLYEMLTGQRPFEGGTVTDTVARILEREPDWQALPNNTPANIRVLLRRCLEKNPSHRLQHMGDAALEISETLNRPPTAGPIGSVDSGLSRHVLRRGVTWAGLIGLALGVMLMLVFFKRSSTPNAKPVKRLPISLPADKPLAIAPPRPARGNMLALSPDGTRLVYVADINGTRQLVMFRLDRLDVQAIPGTESAYSPFFSPDGRWIGFFTGFPGHLKKVSVAGGPSMAICPVQDLVYVHASWGEDDYIVFPSQANSGLSRVSASGGTPKTITARDVQNRDYAFPEVLPGARAVLFTINEVGRAQGRLVLLSLNTNEQETLLESASRPRYLATGHIVYEQRGALMAVPFDIDRLKLRGKPVPVTEMRMTDSTGQATQLAFASDGSLMYVPVVSDAAATRQLVWVDRKGVAEALPFPPDAYVSPRLSPNGQNLTVSIHRDDYDIWMLDIDRATRTRFTFNPAFEGSSLWSPNGERVAFASSRGTSVNIFCAPADGSRPPERLGKSENDIWPHSWSPDGKSIAFSQGGPNGNGDIGLLLLEGRPAIRPLLSGPWREDYPAISPDGRWIAYTSGESGSNEVYLQSFPELGNKRPVSSAGGEQAVWSRNGEELFYRNGQAMMVVSIETTPSLSVGKPQILFQGAYVHGRGRDYDIDPNGQRFLMIKEGKAPEETPARTELILVENWFEELKRLVPAE